MKRCAFLLYNIKQMEAARADFAKMTDYRRYLKQNLKSNS